MYERLVEFGKICNFRNATIKTHSFARPNIEQRVKNLEQHDKIK